MLNYVHICYQNVGSNRVVHTFNDDNGVLISIYFRGRSRVSDVSSSAVTILRE